MPAPVHMVGDVPFKLRLRREVKTRCGLLCTPVEQADDQGRYTMLSFTGGDFLATTIKRKVTCQKCRNLLDIGMIHAKGKS